MSSSPHIDNKKKYALILGKSPTQGLKHTLTAEKLYSINFTKENTKFCLSLQYNGADSYLFANGTEIIKFKAKDSEITPYPLCLVNISIDWPLDNMKKTSLVNNQECKIRPEIVNVNSNEPLLYPFSIKTSKCNGICNNINSPHAKLCVPDVVKNLNIKVFNLMSGTNETINIQLFVTINSAGMKINVGVCEKVIDIGVCNKGFI